MQAQQLWMLGPSAVVHMLPAGQRLVAAADAAVRDAAAAAAPSLARCNDMENGAGTDTEDDPMQSTPPKRSRKRCITLYTAFPSHVKQSGCSGRMHAHAQSKTCGKGDGTAQSPSLKRADSATF